MGGRVDVGVSVGLWIAYKWIMVVMWMSVVVVVVVVVSG